MRKFILIALFAFGLLLFSACGGGLDPDDLDFNRGFSLDVRLEYNGASSAANFTRTAPGTWEGTLTEPYALQGVEVSFSPTEMKVSYSDFAVRYGGDTPTDFNITAFVMLGVLESAFGNKHSTITTGKDWYEITGTADGDSYVLRLDNNGLPTMLEVPNKQLRAEFTSARAVRFAPAIAPVESDFIEE